MNKLIKQLKLSALPIHFIKPGRLYQFVQLVERFGDRIYNFQFSISYFQFSISFGTTLNPTQIILNLSGTDKKNINNDKQEEKEKKEEKDELQHQTLIGIYTARV